VADHDDGEQQDESLPPNADMSKYLVKVFGVTEDGLTVSANLLDFPPYFFVKIPHNVDATFLSRLRECLLTKMPYTLRHTIKSVKLMKRKDFWGFQNGELRNFVRFTFSNLSGMKAAARVFEKELYINGRSVRYKLYENTIEPMLRLMHTRNISPTGWMRIPKGYFEQNTGILTTHCQIDVTCSWTCLQPVDLEKVAPIMVMSFDLECTSSHGDFPVAKKDYKKVANDLYSYVKSNSQYDIASELIALFDPSVEGHLPCVYTKTSVDAAKTALQIKQNSDLIDGIIHGKIDFDEKSNRFVPTKRELKRDDILGILNKRLIGILPALKGDPIIQIGVTVHCYGDRDTTYKHIITLGSCDDIDGATVDRCDTEADMLMKFRDLVIKLDPDVITGYNIFGFDFSYLVGRSEELGNNMAFMKIGRLSNHTCEYKEKSLSSSALGENILKFIDMEGRVLIDIMKVVQRDHKLDSYKLDNVANHFMKMNKHDVSPNDIFRLYKGSASDRRVIAEYCLQDCALCNQLIMKLEILANNIGMSNVCNVPLSYIFMRGQGIKIFSLVAKQCREEEFCIPTLKRVTNDTESEDGYEGAIVLEPKTDMYLEDPVSVLDYASLYPSSMISENLSHDSLVIDSKYDNLPGFEYTDITYDVFEGVGDKKVKVGEKTSRFVQLPEKGVLPRILMKLLKARKDTRKKIEYETLVLEDGRKVSGIVSEDGDNLKIWRIDGTTDYVDAKTVTSRSNTYDEFQKAVLDGLQLAYKVTANSLYGQTGARTSSIYMKEVAAATTATGRKMIMMARDYMIANYKGVDIVYGDTDSLFVKFSIKNSPDEVLTKEEKIARAWNIGQHASQHFKKTIKAPHDLEMEKVMFPFILLSKKRYIAYKYEGPHAKPKLNSMGVVLKRRDNAQVVKTIYGGVIDIILNEQDVKKSTVFLKESLNTLIQGKFPIEELTITKSLKSEQSYKDPDKIAHVVLAKRMGDRDPGNKPQANDRIPFVYFQKEAKSGEKILQGDRIEHPLYIKQNKLKIDYEFYITNQIMNPLLQLYALVLDKIDGYKKTPQHWEALELKLLKDKEGDKKKVREKLDDLKEAEVKQLLFDPILVQLANKKAGNQPITLWFKPKT